MKFQLPRILLLSALLLGNQAQSQQPAPNAPAPADWAKISKQLEEMLELDQAVRKKNSASTHQPRASQVESDRGEKTGLTLTMAEVDALNLTQLKEIVSKHGWPKKSVVGESAARGAFMVLQHADLKYQLEALPLFREAVAAGEAQKAALALLEDRTLVRQRLPQIYGSQVSSYGAYVNIHPVRDDANLDKLRAEVGLEPICAYLKRFAAEDGKIIYPACTN
jgi:hypothetical protein